MTDAEEAGGAFFEPEPEALAPPAAGGVEVAQAGGDEVEGEAEFVEVEVLPTAVVGAALGGEDAVYAGAALSVVVSVALLSRRGRERTELSWRALL